MFFIFSSLRFFIPSASLAFSRGLKVVVFCLLGGGAQIAQANICYDFIKQAYNSVSPTYDVDLDLTYRKSKKDSHLKPDQIELSSEEFAWLRTARIYVKNGRFADLLRYNFFLWKSQFPESVQEKLGLDIRDIHMWNTIDDDIFTDLTATYRKEWRRLKGLLPIKKKYYMDARELEMLARDWSMAIEGLFHRDQMENDLLELNIPHNPLANQKGWSVFRTHFFSNQNVIPSTSEEDMKIVFKRRIFSTYHVFLNNPIKMFSFKNIVTFDMAHNQLSILTDHPIVRALLSGVGRDALEDVNLSKGIQWIYNAVVAESTLAYLDLSVGQSFQKIVANSIRVLQSKPTFTNGNSTVEEYHRLLDEVWFDLFLESPHFLPDDRADFLKNFFWNLVKEKVESTEFFERLFGKVNKVLQESPWNGKMSPTKKVEFLSAIREFFDIAELSNQNLVSWLKLVSLRIEILKKWEYQNMTDKEETFSNVVDMFFGTIPLEATKFNDEERAFLSKPF